MPGFRIPFATALGSAGSVPVIVPPVIVGDSILNCVAERLRILIADCPKFREITNTLTRATALERIHIPDALDTGEHPLPRAIINPLLGNLFREKIGIGHWKTSGSLNVIFECDIPEEYLLDYATWQKVSRQWMAVQIGTIAEEMEALAGTGEGATGETHLNVENVDIVSGPDAYVQDETTIDDPGQVPMHWWCMVEVQFQ